MKMRGEKKRTSEKGLEGLDVQLLEKKTVGTRKERDSSIPKVLTTGSHTENSDPQCPRGTLQQASH